MKIESAKYVTGSDDKIIETKIDAASNMTNFIKLFDSADSSGLSDFNKWPKQV